MDVPIDLQALSVHGLIKQNATSDIAKEIACSCGWTPNRRPQPLHVEQGDTAAAVNAHHAGAVKPTSGAIPGHHSVTWPEPILLSYQRRWNFCGRQG